MSSITRFAYWSLEVIAKRVHMSACPVRQEANWENVCNPLRRQKKQQYHSIRAFSRPGNRIRIRRLTHKHHRHHLPSNTAILTPYPSSLLQFARAHIKTRPSSTCIASHLSSVCNCGHFTNTTTALYPRLV
ncbi:unnamed protein product [Hymenolepis diminuta]|uniref:Secreted protein n=1 Tax=Hymenolepis diminuta TaxID=6216 RepID=A0A0R3S7R5_HYMDI|nr:unnamed protein product [Hymenolepis diminuta]